MRPGAGKPIPPPHCDRNEPVASRLIEPARLSGPRLHLLARALAEPTRGAVVSRCLSIAPIGNNSSHCSGINRLTKRLLRLLRGPPPCLSPSIIAQPNALASCRRAGHAFRGPGTNPPGRASALRRLRQRHRACRRQAHPPPDPEMVEGGVDVENGLVTVTDRGTGQGSVISPLPANIYLHYVLDL